MDINKNNNIENVTEEKIGMAKKMTDNVEVGPINKEQKKAIEHLEEVLNFLKSGQIEDEDVLNNITKPLDDLRSSLKYIPAKPYFGIIPTEITTNILNNLCDTNAFIAASVCLEWKNILGTRFTDKTVTLGERCCGYWMGSRRCLDFVNSVKNEEMIKAAATHKLDVHLVINDSVREVDSKVVTEALISVERFSLKGLCLCDDDDSSDSDSSEKECVVNPMSNDQLKDLFKALEKKMEVMEEVNLEWLDLTKMKKGRMVNCFVNKIKSLTLSDNYHGKILNIEPFINKLSQDQDSAEFKLNQLTLDLKYPEKLALELANALCNVENVTLSRNVNLSLDTVKQLILNIVTDTRPVMMKTLIIQKRINFLTLINPEDLKKLFEKMNTLQLEGDFTEEQVEAAKSLPNVKVMRGFNATFINKGLNYF